MGRAFFGLKRIGRAIRGACRRPANPPAPYGGDEFVVVLPGAGTDALRIVGERLRQAVQDLNIENSASAGGPHLSLSVGGGAIVPTQQDGLLAPIAQADKSLYATKARGRSRVVV